MKEIKGDIIKLMQGEFDAFCITTNGFVKKNGACVMGAGIAKVCRDRFSGIDYKIGSIVNERGNNVHCVGKYKDGIIITFPTKHVWWEQSDVELIERSCRQLMQALDTTSVINKVLLPRPGCGNGGLKWSDVKPRIEKILDDRVYVATF